MKKSVNRIYIIGTSGSGKSFLSNKLSEKLGIPNYDLDDVFFIKKHTLRRSENKRDKLLSKIASRKKWIIEGVYGSWIEKALRKADLVIILDIHLLVLTKRILFRFLRKNKAERESLRDIIKLVKYVKGYKKSVTETGYKHHLHLMSKHKLNYFILKNSKEINQFISSFIKD